VGPRRFKPVRKGDGFINEVYRRITFPFVSTIQLRKAGFTYIGCDIGRGYHDRLKFYHHNSGATVIIANYSRKSRSPIEIWGGSVEDIIDSLMVISEIELVEHKNLKTS
jgi:hypothetical protein